MTHQFVWWFMSHMYIFRDLTHITVHGRRVPVHLKLDHISVLNLGTQIADAEYMPVRQSGHVSPQPYVPIFTLKSSPSTR